MVAVVVNVVVVMVNDNNAKSTGKGEVILPRIRNESSKDFMTKKQTKL